MKSAIQKGSSARTIWDSSAGQEAMQALIAARRPLGLRLEAAGASIVFSDRPTDPLATVAVVQVGPLRVNTVAPSATNASTPAAAAAFASRPRSLAQLPAAETSGVMELLYERWSLRLAGGVRASLSRPSPLAGRSKTAADAAAAARAAVAASGRLCGATHRWRVHASVRQRARDASAMVGAYATRVTSRRRVSVARPPTQCRTASSPRLVFSHRR